uniref:Uncharacterized protein n=1 Tax=Arundo donax TaxID=35708 RepID=A0A0A9EU75_ARUDO
MLVYLILN